MKGQIVNDVIVAFGNQLSGDNIYDIPDDYSPDKYDYIPSVSGVYDPNGFILKPHEDPTPCPYCNRI